MSEKILAALLVFTLLREILFHYTTQKLMNKIMSRNYHEYQMAQAVGKEQVAAEPDAVPELAEDLAHIL